MYMMYNRHEPHARWGFRYRAITTPAYTVAGCEYSRDFVLSLISGAPRYTSMCASYTLGLHTFTHDASRRMRVLPSLRCRCTTYGTQTCHQINSQNACFWVPFSPQTRAYSENRLGPSVFRGGVAIGKQSYCYRAVAQPPVARW